MELVKFAVAVLAVWRIAAFVYYEKGFERVRIHFGAHEYPAIGFIGGQLQCFWCCTVWAAFLVLPFYLWFWWVLLPLAFSGGAILLTQGGRIIWREMVDV